MMDRKEATRQYKQTVQPMGIYQIRNLSNGKVLLGSSKNLHGAQNRFKLLLNLGSHMNHALQKEYIEFGEAQFVFEVLDELSPKDDLAYDYTKDLETLLSMWVDKVQPYGEKGYHVILNR